MKGSETILFLVLAAINAASGIVGAIYLSRLLVRIKEAARKKILYFFLIVGVYFLECIAFAAGMATQVFTVGLAFVWGLFFGLWLRDRPSSRQVLRFSFWLSLYTSIPTLSFSTVLSVASAIDGRNILSSKAGVAFGIPAFVPWPASTILGFSVALAVATLLLKTVITTGGVSILHNLYEVKRPPRRS